MNLDKDGNLLSIPTNNGLSESVYNSRNQLISLGETKYTYDAEGRRVEISNGTVDTRFIYNPNSRLDQLLMETDSNGQPIIYYVYGLGLISQESYAGVKSTYHFDKRGSTLFLTDESGDKTNEYSYDVYGEILTSDGETFNRFIYNGKYGVQADDSGLYFMRNRYYSPEIKRFINRDVIQGNINEPQTFNRFAYVNGNPLNYIDPFGLSKESDSYGIGDLLCDLTPCGSVKTLMDPNASTFDKVWAVVDLGTTIAGGPAVMLGKAVLKGGAKFAAKQVVKKVAYKTEDTLLDVTKRKKVTFDCPKCFVAGTKILTKDGEKNIEDIKVGDMVLAKDENNPNGEVQYKEVVNLFRRTADEGTITLFVGSEKIETTAGHPFWVEGKGWITADYIVVGDILTTFDGKRLEVYDIIISEVAKTVYNFEVKDFHTYFIGLSGIWTHNKGKNDSICNSNKPAIYDANKPLGPSNYPNPDPDMSLPPVKYEPKTIEEVQRMRDGKSPVGKDKGRKSIEAHHRQQKSVEHNDGILDELERATHRLDGNHTRHNKPSEITPSQRSKEIREHYRKRGAEYILPGEGI